MESANVAARVLGNLGHGFLAGYQQAIDNQLRAAPLEQQKKEFEANAPGRAADVAYKQAATQDIQSNQGLKPTPEAAQARYAAETGRIGAETEQAKAGALQSKAQAARTTALTPAELSLFTAQAASESERGKALGFENSQDQRRTRTLQSEANLRDTVAKTLNIPIVQDLERRRLGIMSREASDKSDFQKASLDIERTKLRADTAKLALDISNANSEALQKRFSLQLGFKQQHSAQMIGLAQKTMDQGVPLGQALLQASNSMRDYMPLDAIASDPATFASLNATTQEAISKAAALMSDPNADPSEVMRAVSTAREAADAPLRALMIPGGGGTDTKPTSATGMSRAESRRTELRSRMGASGANAEAVDAQLAKEGVLDVKINGRSIDPTPNYSLPKGLEKRGFEFDKWASENSDEFNRQFALWRAENGDPKESDSVAYDRFKLWRLNRQPSSLTGIGQGARY